MRNFAAPGLFLFVCLGGLSPRALAGASEPAPAPAYPGSSVERSAREDGYQTVEVLTLPRGHAVAERSARGYFLSTVAWDGRRLQLSRRVGPWRADGVERLVRAGPADDPWVVLALREDAPDEQVHRILVFHPGAAGWEQVGDRRLTLPKRRVNRSDVEFGSAEPGWSVVPSDTGARIEWTRGPRVLRVPRGERQVSFTIGAETTQLQWTQDAAEPAIEDGYRDFLPALPVASAEARLGEERTPVETATDGDLGTAWELPRRGALGRSDLTLQLSQTETIRMVRVVPGCAADAESWDDGLEIGSFRIDLGGIRQVEIDRRRPEVVPPGVKAWAEYPLSASFGRQVILFLDSPPRAGWARLSPLTALETKPKARVACVAEVSFH